MKILSIHSQTILFPDLPKEMGKFLAGHGENARLEVRCVRDDDTGGIGPLYQGEVVFDLEDQPDDIRDDFEKTIGSEKLTLLGMEDGILDLGYFRDSLKMSSCLEAWSEGMESLYPGINILKDIYLPSKGEDVEYTAKIILD